MKRILLSLLVLSILSGCTPYQLTVITPLDTADRTITIPPGAFGLKGPIKNTLREEGWKIMTDAGPIQTTGKTGQVLDMETKATFRSRYRMIVESNQIDLCVPLFDPLYFFGISIIDNNTGNEIMTMAGRGCEHSIIEDFRAWLKK